MATIHLEIVTAERTVLEADVDMIVAPGSEGQLGILPRHAPLLTALAPGEIRLKQDDGEIHYAITGGFLEMRDNKATILADAAEHVDEIDIPRAEEAMRRAEERVRTAGADIDLKRALHSQRRAAIRLKIAWRRRGTGIPSARA